MIDWWGPILAEYYGATEGHGVTLIDTAQWRRETRIGRQGGARHRAHL